MFFLTSGCHRYLKHVVMKFICSREDEALQLVRAISVLLELSPQEEKHIKEYLDYKVRQRAMKGVFVITILRMHDSTVSLSCIDFLPFKFKVQ